MTQNSSLTKLAIMTSWMLLSVSIFFVITTGPVMVAYIIHSIKSVVMPDLTYSILYNLMYSNHCFNFFLYCIAGEHFRQSLIVLLYLPIKQQQAIISCTSVSISLKIVYNSLLNVMWSPLCSRIF